MKQEDLPGIPDEVEYLSDPRMWIDMDLTLRRAIAAAVEYLSDPRMWIDHPTHTLMMLSN